MTELPPNLAKPLANEEEEEQIDEINTEEALFGQIAQLKAQVIRLEKQAKTDEQEHQKYVTSLSEINIDQWRKHQKEKKELQKTIADLQSENQQLREESSRQHKRRRLSGSIEQQRSTQQDEIENPDAPRATAEEEEQVNPLEDSMDTGDGMEDRQKSESATPSGGAARKDQSTVTNVTVNSTALLEISKQRNCPPSEPCKTVQAPNGWSTTLLVNNSLFKLESPLVYEPEFYRPLPRSTSWIIFSDSNGHYGAARDEGTHVALITPCPAESAKSLMYYASCVTDKPEIEVRTVPTQKAASINFQLPLLLLLLHGENKRLDLAKVEFAAPKAIAKTAAEFAEQYKKLKPVKATSSRVAHQVFIRTSCECKRRYAAKYILDGSPSMVLCKECKWRFSECLLSIGPKEKDSKGGFCSDCHPSGYPSVPDRRRDGDDNWKSSLLDGFLTTLLLAQSKNSGFCRMLQSTCTETSNLCAAFLSATQSIDHLRTAFVSGCFNNVDYDLEDRTAELKVLLKKFHSDSTLIVRCPCPQVKPVQRNQFALSIPGEDQSWEKAIQSALVGGALSRHSCQGEKNISVYLTDNKSEKIGTTWLLPIQLPVDFLIGDTYGLPNQIEIDSKVFVKHAVALLEEDQYSMLICDGTEFVMYDASTKDGPNQEALRKMKTLDEVKGNPKIVFYFKTEK